MMVADSDVIIDSLKGQEPAFGRIANAIKERALATTVINAFELLSGAKTKNQSKQVTTLLSVMTILPLSPSAAVRAADIRIQLESRGTGIGLADYLIGAICLEHNLPLLSRNQTHFGRIPNLRLVSE